MSEAKTLSRKSDEATQAPSTQNADERQSMTVKRMSDEERAAADKQSVQTKKAAEEQFHAERIKRGHEQNKANAEKLYLGRREVKLLRKAEPDDIGYHEPVACSVIQFVDSGVEQVVFDADIKTEQAPI